MPLSFLGLRRLSVCGVCGVPPAINNVRSYTYPATLLVAAWITWLTTPLQMWVLFIDKIIKTGNWLFFFSIKEMWFFIWCIWSPHFNMVIGPQALIESRCWYSIFKASSSNLRFYDIVHIFLTIIHNPLTGMWTK